MNGQAGDGEHARPRAGREYHHVVAERHLPAVGEADARGPIAVVDAFHLADHDLAVTEHAPERDDHRPRIDRARRDLGQERVVLHEVLGVDDRHPVTEVDGSAQMQGRVEPGEPGAHDEDPLAGHTGRCYGVGAAGDPRNAAARSAANASGSQSELPSLTGSYRVPWQSEPPVAIRPSRSASAR